MLRLLRGMLCVIFSLLYSLLFAYLLGLVKWNSSREPFLDILWDWTEK